MNHLSAVIAALFLAVPSIARAQTACEQLKSLKIAGANITLAEFVAAGPFQNPTGPPPPGVVPPILPAYCRVAATLTPTSDSDIKIEVWLPAGATWNGKYEAVGGGGWVGGISYGAMGSALQEGYATSSTDTGHVGPTAAFAVGHPEKIVDFAYRAVHEMALTAKTIIAAYYSRSPRLSYWTGCSTGGRQGLMEAQRYPSDFDGIVAGAPANNQAHLSAWRFAIEMTVLKDGTRIVPPAKTALLNRAVLAACDALDGVKDGLLSDPLRCRFDPATLACRAGAGGDDCLTARELEMVTRAYSPARKKTGELIYPGLVPGSETGWALLSSQRAEPNTIDIGMYRYAVHQDPNWDWRSFDLDRDTALADERVGYIDAINPDLSSFKARGGKLLIYHGWSDGGNAGAISPLNTLDYYSGVLAKMGPGQDDWFRLFMVPGMAHCGGGPGPNQFNVLAAMERWRESGVAPDRILAFHVTNNRVDMTRPLCPYPQQAVYQGVGSTNDAANFMCSGVSTSR
jgi:feruloyl esterase